MAEVKSYCKERINFNPFDYSKAVDKIKKADVTHWIKSKDGLPEDAICFAQDFGRIIALLGKDRDTGAFIIARRPNDAKQALSTSQIRIFFGEVKNIQMQLAGKYENWVKVKSRFLLLRPKLSYQAARNTSKAMKLFEMVINKALEAVEVNDEMKLTSFQNFVDFVEAILAYHRSYGGKK